MTAPAARVALIVLAVALNLWPWLDASEPAPGFATPARIKDSGSQPLFHEELLNPDSLQPMSHVASICELADGSLAAAWYAGSREGAGDVAIYLSTRESSQGRWSTPRAIVTRESAARDLNRYIKKVGNAVIFPDAVDRLWLVFVTVSVGGWSGSSLNVTVSNDRGTTWAPAERLTLSPLFNLAELVKNAPVPLADAGWAIPIYHELAGTFAEVLWLRESAGRVRATKTRMSAGWFGYQPAMTALGSSRALAFLRNDDGGHTVSIASSNDAGHSWSSPRPLDLPNPDAGLDGIRLHDGRLLLAFNDSATGRENLRLALSADEGRTWTRTATLAEEPGADFSYPFLVQARNGVVHLVYSWQRKSIKHVTFNAAWLDQRTNEARP
jgi:predicted neuraminidase